MNVWLKEIEKEDGQEYCDLLIELARYEDAYARPVPRDFESSEFERFKKSRISLSKNEDIPSYAVPTSTYWVMNGEEPIGYATLRHKIDFNKPGGHLGCCLKRSVQNRGIGKMVADLLSEIAYFQLGITELIYTAKNENIQSQKSLDKIGASLISVHDGYHFYSVDLKRKFGGRKI